MMQQCEYCKRWFKNMRGLSGHKARCKMYRVKNLVTLIFGDSAMMRFVKGSGKLSFMLKQFQAMKKHYKIDKTDEEFIDEMQKKGFVLVKICGDGDIS